MKRWCYVHGHWIDDNVPTVLPTCKYTDQVGDAI